MITAFANIVHFTFQNVYQLHFYLFSEIHQDIRYIQIIIFAFIHTATVHHFIVNGYFLFIKSFLKNKVHV